MFNLRAYQELDTLNLTNGDSVDEAYLINLDSEETVFEFLLVPQLISISGTSEYIEKNALFSNKPFVRFKSAKVTRINITNLEFVTPFGVKSLSRIAPVLDSLRYSNNELIESAEIEEEVDIDDLEEIEDFDDLQAVQFSPTLPTTPNPRDDIETVDADPTELPGTEEEIEVTEIEDFIPATRYKIIDPPKLALIFGERVIRPIALESYTVEESEHYQGNPTRLVLNLTFIGLDNPLI